MTTIGIVGAGAWGTALAQVAAAAGNNTRLWGRDQELIDTMIQAGQNVRYLPDVPLLPEIAPTALMTDLADCDLLVIVVPAQATRAILAALRPVIRNNAALLLAAKGVEQKTLALMSEVAAQELPGHSCAVLSGPTFAGEVARGLPTAVTLASATLTRAEALAAQLGTRSFRPYASDDPIGAEIGGAVKNVLAIACGIVEGLGLGENARSALITRGLAEVTRLAVAKGGRPATLMGLSGLGDITLSCNSRQSRNFSLGYCVASGESRSSLLTEGYYSAPAVLGLANSLNVEMPICEAVHAVLHEGAALAPQIERLLSRPLRNE